MKGLNAILKGEYLIVQQSPDYTQLTKKAYPVKLIVSRTPVRQPCEPGYHLSVAFVQNQRIPLDITLYRHPDAPNCFEFSCEGIFYSLEVGTQKAAINLIP